ncbi:hypothetical protein ANN_02327 [Periplaneta americana]|uniref:Zinc finger PHD-type domain-containing protein n=1 Tax=Periplaneta americana TaxID=6978 RepID=A0ABQ8TW35_PERAM|nr:hypothetical protein ANN_02327 [Periplaneta americana]
MSPQLQCDGPAGALYKSSKNGLQLVDLTFCGPLKSAFNKECETFLKTHAAQKITPYDIAKLFNQAYGRVSSVEKATNGFKRNRIWPLNRNVYSDEDFMAAMNLSPPGKLLESTSEDELDEDDLCDDDELDDINPNTLLQEVEEICAVCGEFGEDGEVLCRCTVCANWTHKECSGVDRSHNYKCDHCT